MLRQAMAPALTAPTFNFTYEEVPGVIEQYTGELRSINVQLRQLVEINDAMELLTLPQRFRDTIGVLQYLLTITHRTMLLIRQPGFNHHGARCFTDGHLFTTDHLVAGCLALVRYLENAHYYGVEDGSMGTVNPEAAYYQLQKLADMHGRISYQQYYGDGNLEEYTGEGPKAHLRDISIQCGHLIRELVETANHYQKLCENLWFLSEFSPHPAPSDVPEAA